MRTQFEVEGKERLIISYQLQKSKIYPQIAKSYAMYFATLAIDDIVKKNTQNVLNKNDFSLLKELHILLCCGKSLFSGWVNDNTIRLVQACGGHGFLSSSGFSLIADPSWSNAILEGINTVLDLQVARELLKSLDLANQDRDGKISILGSKKYFSEIDKYMSYKAPEEKKDW